MKQRPALAILSGILSGSPSLGCDEEQLALLNAGSSSTISLSALRLRTAGVPSASLPSPLAPPKWMLQVLEFIALDPCHVIITTKSPLEVHSDVLQEAASSPKPGCGELPLTQRDMRVFEMERVHAKPSLFGRQGALVFSFPPLNCIITPSRVLLIEHAGEPPSPTTLLILRRLEAKCTAAAVDITLSSPFNFPALALEVCLRVLVVALGERIGALDRRATHCARELSSGRTVSIAHSVEVMAVKRGLVEVEKEVSAAALEVGVSGDALLDPHSHISASLLAGGGGGGVSPLHPDALEGINVAHAMVRRSTVLLQELQSRCSTITSRLLSHERSLNLHLDANRNLLTFFEVSVLLGTFSIALATLVAAYFGMNTPNPLSSSFTAFVLVSVLTSLGAIALVFLLVGWVNTRFRIVGVPAAPSFVLAFFSNWMGCLGAAAPLIFPLTAGAAAAALPTPTTTKKRVNLDEDIVAYLAEAPLFVPLQELTKKCSPCPTPSGSGGVGESSARGDLLHILEVCASTPGGIGGGRVVVHKASSKDTLLSMHASLMAAAVMPAAVAAAATSLAGSPPLRDSGTGCGGGGGDGVGTDKPLSLGDLHSLDPHTSAPSCVWTREGALCIRLDPIFACILSSGTVYLFGKHGVFGGQGALQTLHHHLFHPQGDTAATATASGGGKGSILSGNCSGSNSALQALRVLVEGVHGKAVEEECGRLEKAAQALSVRVGKPQGLRRHQQPSLDLQALRESVNHAISLVSGALDALMPLLEDFAPPILGCGGREGVAGGGWEGECGEDSAGEVVARAVERLLGLRDDLGSTGSSLDTIGRNLQLAMDSQQNLVLRWEVLATITDVSFNIMAGILSFPGQSINNGGYSPDVGVSGSVAAFQSVVIGGVAAGVFTFVLLYTVLTRL